MFLVEPSPSPYDLRFRLAGIPVRIHPGFWLVSLLMGIGPSAQDPMRVLVWVGAVFVSILIHEMGHALAARACRQQTWVTLYSFGGMASYQGPRLSRGQRIGIALAGPGAGFVLAALVAAALIVAGIGIERYGLQLAPAGQVFNPQATMLVYFLFYINIWWGLVNLLPIVPLDGGRVSQELLTSLRKNGLYESFVVSMLVAGGVAVYGALKANDYFLALFFGFLAFQSYQIVQSLRGRSNDWDARLR